MVIIPDFGLEITFSLNLIEFCISISRFDIQKTFQIAGKVILTSKRTDLKAKTMHLYTKNCEILWESYFASAYTIITQ